MYPSTSLFIAVGQLAIVILVLFSYPLQVHPCRNCLDKVFKASHAISPPKTVTPGVGENENEDDIGEDEHGHGHGEMTKFKHFVLTSAIIASGFTVAYLVDDLQLGKLRRFCLKIRSLKKCLSIVVCWCDWIDHHFFYSTRAFLLEGRIIFFLHGDEIVDQMRS